MESSLTFLFFYFLMIFDNIDQSVLAAELQSTLLYARVVLQTCCYHVRIGLIEKNPSSMHSEQLGTTYKHKDFETFQIVHFNRYLYVRS